MKEKFFEREEIYKGNIISVTIDTVELENKEKTKRIVVHHKGASCVLPIDEDGFVYMVRQYRYPFLEYVLEVPAGKKDKGEKNEQTALRELKEETGLNCKELIYLGQYRGNVALLTETIYMYMAKGLTFGEQELDKFENIKVEKHHINDLVKMVLNDEIKDGKSIACILKAYLLYFNN